MPMASARKTPRLDAKTIISYAKNFQDYEHGEGQNQAFTRNGRGSIGQMSGGLNQYEINKKIASFAKSRNSVNIKRTNL